ncbi:MAG: hypothetical protein ACR2RL_06390, partial [Gammaproteobacteria bacterium]
LISGVGERKLERYAEIFLQVIEGSRMRAEHSEPTTPALEASAFEDGSLEDGALKDSALEDGALKDWAANAERPG